MTSDGVRILKTNPMTETKRSTSMNKSLHLLFGQVANEMAAIGIERRTVMHDLKGFDCPIDATFLKEVWRAIQYTQTSKTSTTDLTNAEMSRVYETFSRFLAENYKLNAVWPSIESLYANEWYGN